MITKIKDLITTQIAEQAVVRVEEGHLQPILVVNVDNLVEIAFLLRDSEGYYFDFLSNISAIDYHPMQQFGLVYHLASIPYQTQLTLKVEIENDRRPDNLPEVPSLATVWRTADWHEREAFDLMGIFFTGHPDLRRILLPDDWQGYPLRKDYEDAETYHGIAIK